MFQDHRTLRELPDLEALEDAGLLSRHVHIWRQVSSNWKTMRKPDSCSAVA